jgi:hypothetical protein
MIGQAARDGVTMRRSIEVSSIKALGRHIQDGGTVRHFLRVHGGRPL